jgi:hemin uptake protein HemP
MGEDMQQNEPPVKPADPSAVLNENNSKLQFAPQDAIDIDGIMAGRNEIVLQYKGQAYRLRATRAGKLILNK